MKDVVRSSLYRPSGVALLRAAASSLHEVVDRWPDPTDTQQCRDWLKEIWSRPAFADAVRQSSSTLADRVDDICSARTAQPIQVRRAALAVARYCLRSVGRPTPFGLFAGVAPAQISQSARLRWDSDHRAVARADAEWLADVIDQLESCPELLEALDVVFTDLASRRGSRLEVPHGQNRVTIRNSRAVQAVRDSAAVPVRFGALADMLVDAFAGTQRAAACRMLTELIRQGFLITCLHAPFTMTDPLTYLIDRLRQVGVPAIPAAAQVLKEIESVAAEIALHNEHSIGESQRQLAESTRRRMRGISAAGRGPLAMDLLLDCRVDLPESLAEEMAYGASALLRLTRQADGASVWQDYHARFCDRYGTGTLVPLIDVTNPDAGLGYPATYPGSVLPAPVEPVLDRDGMLLTLAWRAVVEGAKEITLTEDGIDALDADVHLDERRIPPHVEMSGRIHAPSPEAIDCGDYTITLAPARAAGTLTSRFTPIASGSGLEGLYSDLPPSVERALQAQLSFPPVYPHAANVCRIPAYLPHVIPLGEHREPSGSTTIIPLTDLAIYATSDRLHLVSISRNQVIEPQVFHALALDKQPPPLARFLAHLPRAFSANWHEFDWGPLAKQLPYLPRVRYRRTVLSPARWRLTAAELPSTTADLSEWQCALKEWQAAWRCPGTVELRDADRTLRLVLEVQTHAAILRAQLDRRGQVELIESVDPAEFGWIGGHSHEIALPLVATRPPEPSPLADQPPALTNRAHGHLPGSPAAPWLYAKVFTHPERQNEILADHLPELLAALESEPDHWFARYRSTQETDHLRIRVRTPDREHYGAYVTAVGAWAYRLRREGLAARLVFDTYVPEVGRYGAGAMAEAEAVFTADSQAVCAALRHLSAIDRTTLAALNMVDMTCAFFGNEADAMNWLIATRPALITAAPDRAAAEHVVRLVRRGLPRELPDFPAPVTRAWRARAAALASYRRRLHARADIDAVLESLLHMHHNRAIGIDPDGEKTRRRVARQAALAWRARWQGGGR